MTPHTKKWREYPQPLKSKKSLAIDVEISGLAEGNEAVCG